MRLKRSFILSTKSFVLLVLGCAAIFVSIPAFASPGEKVQVCHIPPGAPERFRTITVSKAALPAHLAHGDLEGACNAACAVLCDDGDLCTIDDTGDCEAIGCPQDREAVNCDDNNPCTLDQCNSTAGCLHEPCACDDRATYVADVSGRPIRLEIGGVGVYWVHGMGRLAAEITYTSVPGYKYPSIIARSEHYVSGWQVNDLVMRGISPDTDSELGALFDWATMSLAVESVITLNGVDIENLTLALYDVMPISADTSIVGGRMAELTVSVAKIEVLSYTPPPESVGPSDSTLLEIEGIVQTVFPRPTDIVEAAAGTADSIILRSIGNVGGLGGQSNPIQYSDWFWNSVEYFDAGFGLDRRALSQIDINEGGGEPERVICFETFPASLYYFNPLDEYGATHLLELEIATEWCEQGM